MIISVIKVLCSEFYAVLTNLYSIAKYSNNNKTCSFSYKCHISNCSFEEYVKLFENVIVYNTSVGRCSYIQRDTKIYNCKIGRFCSIGPEVIIAPGQHDIDKLTTHPSILFNHSTPLPIAFGALDFPDSKKINVSIGNDVWIGAKAVLLDGIEVGDGVIIGAGAVVTKNVEPYSVVVGVPAKVIKKRFKDEEIAYLIKNPWWNLDLSTIKENIAYMTSLTYYKEYVEKSHTKNTKHTTK